MFCKLHGTHLHIGWITFAIKPTEISKWLQDYMERLDLRFVIMQNWLINIRGNIAGRQLQRRRGKIMSWQWGNYIKESNIVNSTSVSSSQLSWQSPWNRFSIIQCTYEFNLKVNFCFLFSFSSLSMSHQESTGQTHSTFEKKTHEAVTLLSHTVFILSDEKYQRSRAWTPV